MLRGGPLHGPRPDHTCAPDLEEVLLPRTEDGAVAKYLLSHLSRPTPVLTPPHPLSLPLPSFIASPLSSPPPTSP